MRTLYRPRIIPQTTLFFPITWLNGPPPTLWICSKVLASRQANGKASTFGKCPSKQPSPQIRVVIMRASFKKNLNSPQLHMLLGTKRCWLWFFCSDQGENAWQLDWSNTGGYTTSSTWYQPLPCCCGYQCSGTAAFFEANNAYEATIVWIAAQCAVNLISVDPVLELSTANIGWNLISGGPPSSIDYGQGHTVTMPKSLPTPCYMGVQGCNGAGIPASSSGEDSGKG